ncbi:hypothetical protein Moror_1438 [Moniliophthora roreri MCA 2997]|uniref:Uncharacterized protein n=1 Tax=Moniliophthora roreri (strain MCA 2997) TaxID=1381753 RepID=V2XMM8_MONRO|nr:hypothetical protein Moror_1438 [Moniliophthora roreri MCA 2997]
MHFSPALGLLIVAIRVIAVPAVPTVPEVTPSDQDHPYTVEATQGPTSVPGSYTEGPSPTSPFLSAQCCHKDDNGRTVCTGCRTLGE